MTHATRDLIIALKGDYLKLRRNLLGADYGRAIDVDDEKVTLLRCDHILGSCQVLVEDAEGSRILYSSDFDSTTTPPKSDILVVDGTYGDPDYVFSHSRCQLENKLVEIVIDEVKNDRPVVLVSRRGKLQELMHTMRNHLTIPFLAAPIDAKLAQVYERYGRKIGECFSSVSREACTIISSHKPFVGFFPIGSALKETRETRCTKIRVSAYGMKDPFVKIPDDGYVFAISDHADFNGILEYVKQSDPEIVIVDSVRSGNASELAEQIHNRYPNIAALPMP